MALIETEEAAKRLARVILSDIELYNRKKIQAGADLTTELREGYTLFRSRVAPDLQNLFDEVVADKRFGSARTVAASPPRMVAEEAPVAAKPAVAAVPEEAVPEEAVPDDDAPTPRPYKRHPSIAAEEEAEYLAAPATPPPAAEPAPAAPQASAAAPEAPAPIPEDPALVAARRLARVIVSDIQIYNTKKIAAGADLSGEIAEGRRLFTARVAPDLMYVFEDLVREKGFIERGKPIALSRPKAASAPAPETPIFESPAPPEPAFESAARPEPTAPAFESAAPPQPVSVEPDWSIDDEAETPAPDEAFPPMEETIASPMNVPREMPPPRTTTPPVLPLSAALSTPPGEEDLPRPSGGSGPKASPFDPVPSPAWSKPARVALPSREPTPAPMSRPLTTTPPPSSRPRSVPPPPPPAALAASRRSPFSATPTPSPVRSPHSPFTAPTPTPLPAARPSDAVAPLGAPPAPAANLADSFAPAFENTGLSEAIPAPLGEAPESEPTRQEPTYVAPVTVTAVPATSKLPPSGSANKLSPKVLVAIGVAAAASGATLIYFLL